VDHAVWIDPVGVVSWEEHAQVAHVVQRADPGTRMLKVEV